MNILYKGDSDDDYDDNNNNNNNALYVRLLSSKCPTLWRYAF